MSYLRRYSLRLTLLAIIVIGGILPVMGAVSNVVENVDSAATEYSADDALEMQTLSSRLYNEGNYEDAFALQCDAYTIYDALYGKYQEDCAIALDNMGIIAEKLGKADDAVKYVTEALEIVEKVHGKENNQYTEYLSNLSSYLLNLARYDDAIATCSEELRITEKLYGTENENYVGVLHRLALCHYGRTEYAVALNLMNDVKNILDRLSETNNLEYAVLLAHLGWCHDHLDNFKDAIKLTEQSMTILENLYDGKHSQYASNLNNLCLYYCHLGDFSNALEYGKRSLDLYLQIEEANTLSYAVALGNVAMALDALSNYNEAIKYNLLARQFYIESGNTIHPNYATVLSNLAANYSGLGDYSKAIEISREALVNSEKLLGRQHPENITSLINIASYYAKAGDYQSAIQISRDALDIANSSHENQNTTYALCINNLSNYYSNIDDYPQAIRLVSEALEIQKRLLGTDHPDYLTSLTNLASYHQALGNYPEALRIFTEVMTTTGRVLGEYHPDYARAVNNMACLYSDYGDYPNAVSLSRKAAEIYKNVIGADHDDYAIALGNLSLHLYYAGNIDEAINVGRMSLDIRGRALGTRHPAYAVALGNLALFSYAAGDKKHAIQLTEESLKIREDCFGKQFSECVTALQNLALFAQGNGQPDAAARYAIDANNRQSEIVRTSFSSLSSAERANYWNKTSSHYHLINRITDSYPVPAMVECGYDAVLLSKGILLGTDRDFTSLITESGDSTALAIYNEMRLTRLWINSLREQPSSSTAINLDSLANVANNLEHRLIDRSKIFGDFTRNMAINWKDIRRGLGDSAVAVEFVDFPDSVGSTIYGAYVLSSAMSSPAFVHLFCQSDLDSIRPSELYRTDKLSKLLWQPLDRFIRDARVIYFSPAGNIYNIAVESLPAYDGDGLMSDRHSLYRLSSTRQLAASHSGQPVTKAALYGGMPYDVDNDVLRTDAERYPTDTFRNLAADDATLPDELRRGIQPLPGTLTEVENIRESMSHSPIDAALFTGADATEGAFKALSGKGTGLVHIATHGFYWTREEADNRRNLAFLAAGQQSHSYAEEEKALSRSGLLFAGAQNALSGYTLPDNCNDGILTAREIASIDLRGLDLVVLSACQTGLGEISGDGVFGLQRGFKKAGANSLLMSLWKVNDLATGMLMTQFYKHSLAGKSKHEALALAQKYVRDYAVSRTDSFGNVRVSHPYASPTFWAAFILLDDME